MYEKERTDFSQAVSDTPCILWYNPPHLCNSQTLDKYKALNKNFKKKKSKKKIGEERNVLVFLRLGLAYTTQVTQGQGTLPASTS